MALDPQSVEAKSWLAVVLSVRVLDGMTGSRSADVARANELVTQVLAASPRNPLIHVVRGTVLRAQNRFEEATTEYETALATDSNLVSALHGLALCKLLTGSIDGVIPLEERAIRLSPRASDIGWLYFQIGTVHLLQSRTHEAIAWFEKARSALPGVPSFHSRLAAAYALDGDTERAAAELAENRPCWWNWARVPSGRLVNQSNARMSTQRTLWSRGLDHSSGIPALRRPAK